VDRTPPPVALPIETERLLLRPFEGGDLDDLARLHGDADLVRWIPWGPRSREEAAAVLERKMSKTSIDEEGDGLGLVGILREDGSFLGEFTLSLLSAEHSCAELGFMMFPGHHGRGYATEAGRAILAAAFDGYGLHRVIGRVEPRNTASCRVLERLGMRREAYLVENEWIKGEWQSECIYAILAREWRALGAVTDPA
jgi:RimJ/RimL family protein N-acetyltransferase